jgi:uncharacterized protein (TIGR03032 family)
MSRPPSRTLAGSPSDDVSALHQIQNGRFRDPAQVVSHWSNGGEVDPRLLEHEVRGEWWDVLDECQITLLVTREYEHLIIAIRAPNRTSYMSLPHPSGLAVDRERTVVHVASTRNPNQVFDLVPIAGTSRRLDASALDAENELVPIRSRLFPGCLYLHDLALISGRLYANAVGENAVVRLDTDGRIERAWWPKCIETANGPIFGRNHIQLNSIAAGKGLADSYFSASSSKVMRFRPGHLRFPVDKRGVIFSGATREVFAQGLTRPHSARLHRGAVWVDNSGYGELGFAEAGGFRPVVKLPGWSRGLCFKGDIAFVGTSRVIPRFQRYAPGLNVDTSTCAVHAVDLRTGEIRGSLRWKWGNQIFAIDWLPRDVTSGFPWVVDRKSPTRIKRLFYAFTTELTR